MDRQLRNEIRADVQAAMAATLTQAEERWISGSELCAQFSMITPKLLKVHGDIFPRRKMKMTGTNGKTVATHWAYPQHLIALNIAAGVYDDMRVMKDL